MNGAPEVWVGLDVGYPSMNGASEVWVGFYVWATRSTRPFPEA
jgi:hypothetical protein